MKQDAGNIFNRLSGCIQVHLACSSQASLWMSENQNESFSRSLDRLRFLELALNLIWAIIAIASYALLCRDLASRGAKHARGPSRSDCVIALTCVLAILFPAISLSDDLHEMQVTLEDASPSVLVIKKCVVKHFSNQDRTLQQAPFILDSFATGTSVAILGFVSSQQISRFSPGQHLVALGRAPPSFDIAQHS
jgi:hypothetical protein